MTSECDRTGTPNWTQFSVYAQGTDPGVFDGINYQSFPWWVLPSDQWPSPASHIAQNSSPIHWHLREQKSASRLSCKEMESVVLKEDVAFSWGQKSCSLSFLRSFPFLVPFKTFYD